MRKVIFAIIAIGLMTFASCNKGGPGAAGYWTFQGSAYDAASCTGSTGGILTASNINNNNFYTYGTIECNFYQNLPATGGTFYVVAYPPLSSNQLSIGLTIDGTTSIPFVSTGGGGTETATVTVSNGNVSVKGSGIEMAIDSSGVNVDSSVLYIDITQTQQ